MSKNQKKILILELCFVLIIVFAAVGIKHFLSSNHSSSADSLPAVSNENEQDTEIVAESASYKGLGDVRCKAGSREASLIYKNEDSNEIVITVLLKKDSTKLFQSAHLMKGESLSEITLESEQDKGVYDIVIMVDTYSKDSGTYMSGVIYNRKLYVE